MCHSVTQPHIYNIPTCITNLNEIKYLPANRIFMPFPAFVSNYLDQVVLGLGEEVIEIRYTPPLGACISHMINMIIP